MSSSKMPKKKYIPRLYNLNNKEKSVIDVVNEIEILEKRKLTKEIRINFLNSISTEKTNYSKIINEDLNKIVIDKIIRFNYYHYISKSHLRSNYYFIYYLLIMKKNYIDNIVSEIDIKYKNIIKEIQENTNLKKHKNTIDPRFNSYENNLEMMKKKYPTKQIKITNDSNKDIKIELKIFMWEFSKKIDKLVELNNYISNKILQDNKSKKKPSFLGRIFSPFSPFSKNKKKNKHNTPQSNSKSTSTRKVTVFDNLIENYRKKTDLPEGIRNTLLEKSNYQINDAGGGGHCGYLSVMAYCEKYKIDLIKLIKKNNSNNFHTKNKNNTFYNSRKLKHYLHKKLSGEKKEMFYFILQNSLYFEADTYFLLNDNKNIIEEKVLINKFIDQLLGKLNDGMNSEITDNGYMDDSILKLLAYYSKIDILLINDQGGEYDKLFICPENIDTYNNCKNKLEYLLNDNVIKLYNKNKDHFQWFERKKELSNIIKNTIGLKQSTHMCNHVSPTKNRISYI